MFKDIFEVYYALWYIILQISRPGTAGPTDWWSIGPLDVDDVGFSSIQVAFNLNEVGGLVGTLRNVKITMCCGPPSKSLQYYDHNSNIIYIIIFHHWNELYNIFYTSFLVFDSKINYKFVQQIKTKYNLVVKMWWKCYNW